MPKPLTLTLERKGQDNETAVYGDMLLVSPSVDENYWAYRVRLSEGQSLLGFPKYDTVGIGFAAETDYNTNLPYTLAATTICDHIWRNVGGPIARADVLAAIKLIQDAVTEDRS